MPGRPAELTVGDAFQAQILLPANNFTNRLVFNTAQIGRADAPVLFILAGLEQLWGTQQTADVIGAEWGSFRLNHRFQLTQTGGVGAAGAWTERASVGFGSRFCRPLFLGTELILIQLYGELFRLTAGDTARDDELQRRDAVQQGRPIHHELQARASAHLGFVGRDQQATAATILRTRPLGPDGV